MSGHNGAQSQDKVQAILRDQLARLVERVNAAHRQLLEDMQRNLAELGTEMLAAGIPLDDEVAREIRRLDNGLDGPADWAFRRAYLQAANGRRGAR